MNARRMNFPIVGVVLLLFSGCAMFEGWNSNSSASDSQANTQYSYLAAQIQPLTERVAGLEQSNARLQRDLADVQTRLSQMQTGAGGSASATELQQLRSQVQQLQVQQEKDKQAILDQLARELAGLAARRSASPPASSGSSDVGYEHTVKQGDTLAAVAKTYGTT